MIYDKDRKAYLIKGFTESRSYEGDTLSTDECPLKRDFCRKYTIGAVTSTEKCDRFVGTCGDDFHRTYPIKIEDHDFRIICKGPNSMDFILGEE